MAVNIKGKPLYWSTGIDNSGLKKGSTGAQGIIGGLKSSVTKADVFAGLAISAGVAFMKISKHAVKFSQDFEHTMLEVKTISKSVQDDYDGVAQAVIDIGATVPETATGIAKGLYQIVSAGYDGAQALDILTASARGAVAAVTDTFTVADAMTSIMNAYGQEVGTAAEISDQLFTIVKNGKTTMGEIAPIIGTVTGLAAQAGLSFKDLAAAYALGTKTLKTDIFTTGIRGFLQAIIKPTDDAINIARELGLEFDVTALKTKGLGGFMQDLIAATDGNIETLAALFPNVRGLNGVLALAADGGARLEQQLKNIDEAAGATDAAFGIMIGSVQNKADILKNNIDVALKPLGDALLAKKGDILGAINEMFETGEIEKYIKVLVIFTKVLGVAVTGLVGYKVAVIAANLVTKISAAIKGAATLATTLYGAAHNQLTRRLALAAIAQKAMNVATKSNPYVWAATAILTLATAMKLFAKDTDAAAKSKRDFDESLRTQKAGHMEFADLVGDKIKIGHLLTTEELDDLKTRIETKLKEIREIEVDYLTKHKEDVLAKRKAINAIVDPAAKQASLSNYYAALNAQIKAETGFTNKELLEYKRRLNGYKAYITEKAEIAGKPKPTASRETGKEMAVLDPLAAPKGGIETSKAYTDAIIKRTQFTLDKVKQLLGKYGEMRLELEKRYSGKALAERLRVLDAMKVADMEALMETQANFEIEHGKYKELTQGIETLNYQQLTARRAALEQEIAMVENNVAEEKKLKETLADVEDKINKQRVKALQEVMYVMREIRSLMENELGIQKEYIGWLFDVAGGQGEAIVQILSGDIAGGISTALMTNIRAMIRVTTIEKGVTDEMTESVAQLTHQYTLNEQALRSLSGSALNSARRQQIDLIQQQIAAMQTLLQAEKDAERRYLFGLIRRDVTDPDKQREYEQQLAALFGKQDDYLAAIAENFTQTTAESIADGIIQGMEEGKSASQAYADSFEDMMRAAVLQSFKDSITLNMGGFYEQFAEMAESDGVLTKEEQEELRALFMAGADATNARLRELEAVTGLDLFGAQGVAGSQMAGAIRALTEETGNLMVAQFNGMRVNLQRQVGIMTGQLDALNQIEMNTSYNYLLAEINDKLSDNSQVDALRGIGG